MMREINLKCFGVAHTNFGLPERKCYLVILLLLIFTGCRKDGPMVHPSNNVDTGGQVTRIEALGPYSQAEAIVILKLYNPEGKFETTNGYRLYRITYRTKNFDGAPIEVSGLMAVPDTTNIKGVVSYHHGTNPDRKNVISNATHLNPEGLVISSIFSGNGYVLLAPDYIGLGVSTEVPTYLHTATTVQTIIDFIKAGSTVLKDLTKMQSTNLFLVGFFQGGSATAGVHRQLEIENLTGLTLKASAAIAGAYNLKEVSLPYAIQNNSMLYLGYVVNSYGHIYNQPLNTIIKDEYVRILPKLFDGSKNYMEIEAALPDKVEDLYNQSMLDAIRNGQPNWFTTALAENETYRWKPVATLRLFYGTEDKDVSPQDAIAANTYMKGLGGNELIDIGNYDHEATERRALPEIQRWFNQIK